MATIGTQIGELTASITTLEKTEGELAVSSNACKLLAERCDTLEERASYNERTITNNGQYLRNKQVEVKLLPTGIAGLPVPQLKKPCQNCCR